MKIYRLAFLVFFGGVCLTAPCSAWAEIRSLGTFGPWSAFTGTENGQMVCYMMAHPQKPGTSDKRGETYFMITHRPSENSFNVVSFGAGFTLKRGSDVRLEVNSKGSQKSFRLFTDRDAAWARDAATDHQISIALQQGKSLTIRSMPTPSKAKTKKPIAPEIHDLYTLTGATAAIRAIDKACGR
jgi:hypothetical protein